MDKIERYGIKCGVRCLVKDVNELGVEVDGAIFDGAYTESGASWREEEDIKTFAPIHDKSTGLSIKKSTGKLSAIIPNKYWINFLIDKAEIYCLINRSQYVLFRH